MACAALSVRSFSADPLFAQTLLATDLQQPIALAFAPSGELFIAQKTGTVRVLRNGVMDAAPFHSVEVHTDSESGLLGLALDPDFSTNGYVYLFATVSPREQQIIRVTARDGRGEEPVVIRGFLPTVGLNHNGGCLRVGPDRKLYFSIGDTQNGDTAQQMSTFAGKICRINLDGSTPADNPFFTTTGFPRAIWALGFRNPFRFDIAPDGRLFVLDVGSDNPNRREEVNIIRRGENGGWPLVEGDFDPSDHPDFVRPIHTYTEQGSAPAGACYYTGGQFPPAYRGNFFHADYVSNWVYRVVLDGDRAASHTEFIRMAGGPVDLAQGPDGAIYFCCLIDGTVGRISYVGPAFAAPDETNAPNTPSVSDMPSSPVFPADVVDFLGDSNVPAPANPTSAPNAPTQPVANPPPLCGTCTPLALGLLSLAALAQRARLERAPAHVRARSASE